MPEPSAARGEITLDSVRHLAGLARIELTEAELASLTRDLDSILHSVAKVSAVATDDIPPTSHPVPIMNVMREDVVADVLTQAEALQNAPDSADGMFRVASILGEEQ